MLRLEKSLGWAVLAAGLMMPLASASAQAPAPQATTPQAATSPGTSLPAATPPPNAHARHKKAAPVAEVPATPPAPPPTLEQSAPTPPRVSFQNGLLTIDATNSTLSQVLRAVQSRTGASIDIPGGAGSERVVAQLGPGLPRDVLNTLLNGSKFDYVILGVTGNPGAVEKVILTPRQAGQRSRRRAIRFACRCRTTSRKRMKALPSPTPRKTSIGTRTRLQLHRHRVASAIP